MPAITLPENYTPDESPMSAVVGPITVVQLAVIETRLPTWATATVIYRDAADRVVGYGVASRDAGTFSVLDAGPSAARTLCASPR